MAHIIVVAILIFGSGGEIAAINALSSREAGGPANAFIYLAVVVLTIAAAVVPVLALLKSMARSFWQSARRRWGKVRGLRAAMRGQGATGARRAAGRRAAGHPRSCPSAPGRTGPSRTTLSGFANLPEMDKTRTGQADAYWWWWPPMML
jgi:hypothetical protein